MTARMMMLNCVQDTSVSAAVVLSAGLLRLVSRAWGVVLVSAPDLESGTALSVVGVTEGEGEVAPAVGTSAVIDGVGRRRRTEETKKKKLNFGFCKPDKHCTEK